MTTQTVSMGVKDAIAARHSVRTFAKAPLDQAEISELLEAARTRRRASIPSPGASRL